ncbi:DUF7544 domain-containing protein [Halorubrum sp. HHNYT27]|uniref:DUF7544 domain-containing protein n=1 Tax=Halorubrum sp. HHNYT27 TaxID=3402275 RepID=UPI003EC125DE
MSWHAVDAVDDSVDATRRFLFPFSPVRWTKLALLVLFMGGGGVSTNVSAPAASGSDVTPSSEVGSGSAGAGSGGFGPGSGVPDAIADAVTPELLALGVVGLILLIVAVSVASLSLRLVFYDALRTDEVRIIAPFLSRLRQSLGLFVFTVALSVVAGTPVALAVGVTVLADAPTGSAMIDSMVGTLVSLPIGAVVALGLVGAGVVAVAALALRFTYEFVVPTMVVADTGVIGGWRRFLPVLRTDWPEFFVYLVVHLVISIGLSVVVGVATLLALALVATVAGLVLLIAAALLGGLGALLGTTSGTVAIAVVAIAGVVGLVALVLPVQVVALSYRLIYEVSTLEGVDPELSLLHPALRPGTDEPTGASIEDDSDR